LEFEWRMESWSADSQMRASPSATGLAWFPTPAEESEEGVELGDMGDGRVLDSAMSFHLGSDIWLVPNGLALRLGGSMEYAPTTQPDAAMFGGPRYGVGAGLSFTDRGYAIDLGYYHLFSEATELTSGSLPLRNPSHSLAEAESDTLSVQNNGKYTSSHGFLGLGIRADMTTFASRRKSQRKAWYQIWSKGTGGFGRGGF
jgi:hypothetical protein